MDAVLLLLLLLLINETDFGDRLITRSTPLRSGSKSPCSESREAEAFVATVVAATEENPPDDAATELANWVDISLGLWGET